MKQRSPKPAIVIALNSRKAKNIYLSSPNEFTTPRHQYKKLQTSS